MMPYPPKTREELYDDIVRRFFRGHPDLLKEPYVYVFRALVTKYMDDPRFARLTLYQGMRVVARLTRDRMLHYLNDALRDMMRREAARQGWVQL